MTKSEEIEALRKFAKTLPEGTYLADLFKHLLPQFEQDIRSDIVTLPELHTIERDVLEARAKLDEERRLLAATRKELSDLGVLVRTMQDRKVSVLHELDELRKSITRILQ